MNITVSIVEDDAPARGILTEWIRGAEGFQFGTAYEHAEAALAGLPAHASEHCHTYQEAAAAVASGEAQAALLLRPVTVDQIAEWAAARRRMPPKTTYFWPKPRTGMVFRALGD